MFSISKQEIFNDEFFEYTVIVHVYHKPFVLSLLNNKKINNLK